MWGVQGSNACPDGSYTITDEAQCFAAAATAGIAWVESRDDRFIPRGCIRFNGNSGIYFNRDATGTAHGDYRPLCAVGPGPPQACVCVRACG
jgi:hypothetical protein